MTDTDNKLQIVDAMVKVLDKYNWTLKANDHKICKHCDSYHSITSKYCCHCGKLLAEGEYEDNYIHELYEAYTQGKTVDTWKTQLLANQLLGKRNTK
jgi:hypothetical protein